MSATSGPDLLLVAYAALAETEQDQVFERITRLRLERLAEDENETGRMLSSLRRVSQHLGQPPTTTSYREAWAELRGLGHEVENLNSVIRHFGSWRVAREALELADSNSPRRIDDRLRRRRRLDKVWRYTAETLAEVMTDCVGDLGLVPQVAEFEHWRRLRLDQARAQGDDALQLPTSGPYRRRWGSWEKALLALGYTPDQVAERLERLTLADGGQSSAGRA
jgi:hypothetical protein